MVAMVKMRNAATHAAEHQLLIAIRFSQQA